MMTCQSALGLATSGLAAADGVAAGFAVDDFALAGLAKAAHARVKEIALTMEKAGNRMAIIHYNMQEKCHKAT